MRERENSREHDPFGREGNQVGNNDKGCRRDFREELFSIFVDNLNPSVDSMGLWGIFKPFGKVMDVFLSTKNRLRREHYAFIRFGSLEEANKVERMTNEMYIYGWSIVSKVASYGWNRRRSIKSREIKQANEERMAK
ncbi:hypothetical protein Ddye_020347 [Dipteronia dyeriana]|uniref:RRM domain-containing protein n=1 Tax=Dipteronia dyeriana TaxID=168575 RepID=A0AAD9WWL9_9ROSI|nr:hypothetical protein Ddye_020347 [Dipteronia dyeriana]